ncbi:transposase [Pseudomonas sp. BN414]|uniref:transposase n=1 Tax=Pseudomonas taiwanensis TaxID=470150 RepID=UPI0015BF6EF0|nr:transposase [Pseudomonas sp. BN414]NWL76053.1 hypothetical protein [Pseudomonas taiwanensis]
MYLDLGDLNAQRAAFYSPIRHLLIDPELMVRMLSSATTATAFAPSGGCAKVHLNLAYRRFCRVELEDEVPYHSTFSKNRHFGLGPVADDLSLWSSRTPPLAR